MEFLFVAAVYMLSDLLPPFASLSWAFQKRNINFSVVKPLVQGPKAVFASQKNAPGVHFHRLPTEIENLCSYGFRPYDQHKMSKFRKDMYDPYVTALSHHLEAMFPYVALIDAFSISHWCLQYLWPLWNALLQSFHPLLYSDCRCWKHTMAPATLLIQKSYFRNNLL